MTLAEIYEARVAAGTLRPDPAQRAVLPELERIRTALNEPPKRGFFARFQKPELIRGLYLWGGVGRGKSMVMSFDKLSMWRTMRPAMS